MSQAGAKSVRKEHSLERTNFEIDVNKYEDVIMEDVQKPVEGASVDVLEQLFQRGEKKLYSIEDSWTS